MENWMWNPNWRKQKWKKEETKENEEDNFYLLILIIPYIHLINFNYILYLNIEWYFTKMPLYKTHVLKI